MSPRQRACPTRGIPCPRAIVEIDSLSGPPWGALFPEPKPNHPCGHMGVKCIYVPDRPKGLVGSRGGHHTPLTCFALLSRLCCVGTALAVKWGCPVRCSDMFYRRRDVFALSGVWYCVGNLHTELQLRPGEVGLAGLRHGAWTPGGGSDWIHSWIERHHLIQSGNPPLFKHPTVLPMFSSSITELVSILEDHLPDKRVAKNASPVCIPQNFWPSALFCG